MLRSLRTKFFILLLGVSIIALSSALVLRELMIKDFHEYTEGQSEDRVYWVIADLEGTYEKYSFWKEDVIAKDAVWALMLGLEIRILGNDEKLIMDIEKALARLSPLVRDRVFALSQLSRVERRGRFLPYPLFFGGKEIGSLEVRFLRSRGEQFFITRSNRFLVFSLLGLGGVALLVGTIFSRRLTNPIKALMLSAEAVSEGNLKTQVSISGRDEIGRLANSFNKMIRSLEMQESLRKKLVSNVTHEIRTPLSILKGEIAGMIDGIITKEGEQLQSLYEEVCRIENIFEDLEELSRAQAGAIFIRKRAEKLKPLLLAVKRRFDSLFLAKGVALDVQSSDELSVYADPEKLNQIMVNLLSNALKAASKGGHVWIRTGEKKEEVYIEVEDNGHGIEEKDLPFVFERFFHTAEGGLGIGLTIVKELVDAHNGRIELNSEFGKGTVVTVHLPKKESS